MSKRRFSSLIPLLLAVIFLGFGCATKRDDPSTDWEFCWPKDPIHSNPLIKRDYYAYVQSLPARQRETIDPAAIFIVTDGKGHHAVHIKVPLKGTWYEHVLVYDEQNQRVKTLKYPNGHYQE